VDNPYQAPASNMDSPNMMPCKGCGKTLHCTAASCPGCGASQRTRRYKSKTVAAAIAFFLGGLGLHRFYLGQWWGGGYLLLFWTSVPAWIAIVECIVFLVSDKRKWDNKYNEGRP